MREDSLLSLVAAANAPLTDPDMNRHIGMGAPQFELYHFALSVCSQKVRVCLMEKEASFAAHDINLQMPSLGNYDPAYVRLRLQGAGNRPLVGNYSGQSSVSSEGFDPAVVPTLVDLREQKVYVDSVAICEHIDTSVTSAPALMPPDLAQMVRSEMAIVDATPHVAVLYGAHPDIDFRPERLRQNMPGVHDRKIEKIRLARSAAEGDAQLEDAFDAKIEKEAAGRSFVATPDKMRRSVADIVSIVSELDGRLNTQANPQWICGDRFSLADVFWAVSLFRLKWLGMAFCWNGAHPLNEQARPAVADYAARLFDRPSFRDGVIDWPGIARTEYVSEYYTT